jgi:hypothetical protein
MVYRYRPKGKRIVCKFGKLAKFINPKRIKNETEKKAFIAIMSVLLIFVVYFVVSSATSYIVYTGDIENELNKTRAKLVFVTADRDSCKKNLTYTEDDLKVCKADLEDKSGELTTCTDLRVKYKDERDKWEQEYKNMEDSFSKCDDEKTGLQQQLVNLTANYTALKSSLDNATSDLNEMQLNYRNYVCCLTKFTNPSATVVYWKVENNKILCQIESAAGYTGMDVSELGC